MVEDSDIKVGDDEVIEIIELKFKDFVDKVVLEDKSDLEVVPRIAFVEKDVSKLDECCELCNIIELEEVDVIKVEVTSFVIIFCVVVVSNVEMAVAVVIFSEIEMKSELVTVNNVDETTFEKSTELVELVTLVKLFDLVETSRLDN